MQTPPSVASLQVELFADGADLEHIRVLAASPLIRGFTTNPTLMRRAGLADYVAFAQEAAEIAGARPISFEVFSDDFDEMELQARTIASWRDNVYVKIPVTDTRGRSAASLIERLVGSGVKVNVTALLTVAQVEEVARVLEPTVPSFVSLFAGRIADTGRDPLPYVQASPKLIWASPREILNVFQASDVGCDVITLTSDVLAKLELIGKDLDRYSLETVGMFFHDARVAGYEIDVGSARIRVTS
jgi:transaldolase